MRLYPDDTKATRTTALIFAVSHIMRSTDWQQVQEAMANNDKIHTWLTEEAGGDEMAILALCQSVIREAETRIGDNLPAGYSS